MEKHVEKEILALDFNPVVYFTFLKNTGHLHFWIYCILNRGATQLMGFNYSPSTFRPKIVSIFKKNPLYC